MMIRKLTISLIIIGGLTLSACNFDAQEEVTLTPEVIIDEPVVPLPEITDTPAFTDTPQPSATTTVTSTPSLTPSPEPTEVAVQPTPTPPPPPTDAPTEIVPPTEELGPWEYVVQPNETLIEIIQRPPFNYRTLDVIPEIVRINANLPNADFLPVGDTILIPRPTADPQSLEAPPEPEESEPDEPEEIVAQADEEAVPAQNIPDIRMRDRAFIPRGYEVVPYQIQAGQTVIGLVQRIDGLTLALFAQYNADISFAGCNFEQVGGGPNCAPNIGAGQWVNVLRRLPPPTATPTPIGDETATPTPTYAPPIIVSPPQGATTTGRVRLSWVGVSVLKPDEYYIVTVRDLTAGSVWQGATRSTNLLLPVELIPDSGERHDIEWSVTIGTITETGDFRPIAGDAPLNRFGWNSR
ncbi:MAG: hypothetical protein EA396_13700 [Anaerolineaceae bacterium]|nr:MAG: hypothetical protein EA396_13700 [Anaerolineaceae bacterium]